MPVKTKAKKTVKPAKKAAAKPKNKLECGICGYRVIVDEACGWREPGPRPEEAPKTS
jgi:hypothetical protein